jgi:hypothetical protein
MALCKPVYRCQGAKLLQSAIPYQFNGIRNLTLIVAILSGLENPRPIKVNNIFAAILAHQK